MFFLFMAFQWIIEEVCVSGTLVWAQNLFIFLSTNWKTISSTETKESYQIVISDVSRKIVFRFDSIFMNIIICSYFIAHSYAQFVLSISFSFAINYITYFFNVFVCFSKCENGILMFIDKKVLITTYCNPHTELNENERELI